MAAYIFAEIEITNPEGYKEYTAQVPATVAKYGGRFLVRGGNAEALEGDWQHSRRRVLLEFPTIEQAKRWWDSTEYEKPKAVRKANSKGRLILLEGVSG